MSLDERLACGEVSRRLRIIEGSCCRGKHEWDLGCMVKFRGVALHVARNSVREVWYTTSSMFWRMKFDVTISLRQVRKTTDEYIRKHTSIKVVVVIRRRLISLWWSIMSSVHSIWYHWKSDSAIFNLYQCIYLRIRLLFRVNPLRASWSGLIEKWSENHTS